MGFTGDAADLGRSRFAGFLSDHALGDAKTMPVRAVACERLKSSATSMRLLEKSVEYRNCTFPFDLPILLPPRICHTLTPTLPYRQVQGV